MIEKENLKDIYPLSPMQEGMLFHFLYDRGSSAYIEQFSHRLTSDLDVGLFHESWNRLFKRHDIFRTIFVHEKTSRPLQVVVKEKTVGFHFEDLRNESCERQEAFLSDYREKDRRRGFDPTRGPLLRVAVFQLERRSFEVIRTHHHILLDGWSSGILLREVLEIYKALGKGRSPRLPEPVPYSGYIRWLEIQDRDTSEKYWQAYLDGYTGPSAIPLSRPHAKGAGYEAAAHAFTLNETLSARLADLAVRHQTTLSVVIRTIWGVLLGRYNNTRDVVFGTVVSGRPPQVRGVEQIVGLFINTVPVRIRSGPDDSFAALMDRVHREFLTAHEHGYIPLSVSQGGRVSVDHLVAFENYPYDQQFQAAVADGEYGITVERVTRFEHTHYNFVMVVNPGKCLQIAFQFNARVITVDRMERMAGNFLAAAEAVSADPLMLVDEIDILPSGERHMVIKAFNATETGFQDDRTLDSLFEERAARHPDRPAVIWEGRTTTYRELNEKSNALAHYMRTYGHVRYRDRVAVILERSDRLIIGLLAILKAGGVYVPMDPAYPVHRIAYMLKDSRCKAALTDVDHRFLVPEHLTMIDADRAEEYADTYPVRNQDRGASSRDLAYLIYTSGSTGRPKGVMIEHRSAVNLVSWHRRRFNVTETGRATVLASPGFDASIWEMLPYLLSGASLYPIGDDDRADPEKLIRIFEKNTITHSFVPPAVCEEVCRTHKSRLSSTFTLLTGGDVLTGIGRGDIRVVNNYGPTECTVVSGSIVLSPDSDLSDSDLSNSDLPDPDLPDPDLPDPDLPDPDLSDSDLSDPDIMDGGIPIGRPIDNTQIFILDHLLRPVPVGISGEIYIGGVGLARGYWDRAELTEAQFVPHPFDSGKRLYRTGDKGQWLIDGNIRFLGRCDHQVKIRGFRVEPGEIENRLLQHPLITQAVVRARKAPDETLQLAAYIVAGEIIPVSDLRAYLSATLPDYMVPRWFAQLDKFPLTAAGKIDRNALPDPEKERLRSTAGVAKARTSTERGLAEIWADVLGIEPVGVHENFFELGGHSLTATRVISQVRLKFGVEVPLGVLFEMPTIEELSVFIDRYDKDAVRPTTPPPIRRVSRRALTTRSMK